MIGKDLYEDEGALDQIARVSERSGVDPETVKKVLIATYDDYVEQVKEALT